MINYHDRPGDTDNHENIIAALERRDHMAVIELLEMPLSILETLSPFMQEPFPTLTELDIYGESMADWVLPETSLSGSAPLLRRCAICGVLFLALPSFLISTFQITDLTLTGVAEIPPEQMATCLTALPNLKELVMAFDFLCTIDYPCFLNPPPLTRVDLPLLTHFKFEGFSQYLEELVARIYAPFLHRLFVNFVIEPDISESQFQFYQFIARSERLKEFHRATIDFNPWLFSWPMDWEVISS